MQPPRDLPSRARPIPPSTSATGSYPSPSLPVLAPLTRASSRIFMRLEAKLGLSSGVLMAAMVLSAYTAHLRVREVNRLSALINGTRIPIVNDGMMLEMNLMKSIRNVETYILYGVDPASSARLRKDRSGSFAAADKWAEHLLQRADDAHLNDDPTFPHNLEGQMNQLRSAEQEIERLHELHTPEATAEADDLLQHQVLPVQAALTAALDQFIGSQKKQSAVEIELLQQANHQVLLTLWSATGLAALLGGIFSLVIGRRLVRAVHRLGERANAIATGDLTGAPLDLGSADQIVTLGEDMQRMQESLAGIIGTVAETAGSLASSAVSMRTASDQVHRRVDEQTQQTEQTATALQEMSASIAEVSRHTQSAAESARSAAQTAREGGAVVQRTLDTMQSIAAAVSESSSTISLLGEDSRRISQIVTVISDIARKTNLLALNAAIEAARAGDQGRGFAVVASEVRHLAESTAQATSEIAAMIEALQARTRDVVAGMKAGNATVEQGVSTTQQAGHALERIIGMAERVERMITQIAIAAGQQASAADQSSASLDSIHMLSIENLAELATTTAGIEKLQHTAATLEHQVERFRLASAPIDYARATTQAQTAAAFSVARAQLLPRT